jgi:ABC-type multidrug transport system fused ATPase/permease subunit
VTLVDSLNFAIQGVNYSIGDWKRAQAMASRVASFLSQASQDSLRNSPYHFNRLTVFLCAISIRKRNTRNRYWYRTKVLVRHDSPLLTRDGPPQESPSALPSHAAQPSEPAPLEGRVEFRNVHFEVRGAGA